MCVLLTCCACDSEHKLSVWPQGDTQKTEEDEELLPLPLFPKWATFSQRSAESITSYPNIPNSSLSVLPSLFFGRQSKTPRPLQPGFRFPLSLVHSRVDLMHLSLSQCVDRQLVAPEVCIIEEPFLRCVFDNREAGGGTPLPVVMYS